MVYITKQPTLNNGLFIHCNVIIKINILPYTMAYIKTHPTLHNGLYYKISFITQWPITKHFTLHNGLLIHCNVNIVAHIAKQPTIHNNYDLQLTILHHTYVFFKRWGVFTPFLTKLHNSLHHMMGSDCITKKAYIKQHTYIRNSLISYFIISYISQDSTLHKSLSMHYAAAYIIH